MQVSDIPEGVTKNDLHVYFQKRKNGGGEVKRVTLLAKGHALVVFDDLKGTQGSIFYILSCFSYMVTIIINTAFSASYRIVNNQTKVSSIHAASDIMCT